MISFKIKTPDPNKMVKKLQGLVTPQFTREVENEVIPEVKRLIATGQSPVEGFGRFPQYKDRATYPGDLKPANPVNLYLSGKMLSKYGARMVSGLGLAFGYDPNRTDKKLKGQVEGNNLGTKKIPRRRFIPQGGETFTVSVMRKLKDLYAKRLSKLFS